MSHSQDNPQVMAGQSLSDARLPGWSLSRLMPRILPGLFAACLVLLAGCGGSTVIANSKSGILSVSPGKAIVDTNCTGCNALNLHAGPVHQFSASLSDRSNAAVTWTVSGGDAVAGPGTISAVGQYSPPGYLTADRVEVQVTATLKADPAVRATSTITVTPGFLRPLTPENVALGPNGTVSITAYLAEAGGTRDIRFALSDTPSGSTGGEGTLGPADCRHVARAFTSCTITYTAPPVTPSAGVTYIVASTADSSARTEAAVLLNASGVNSNPTSHQSELAAPIAMGSSGGNNSDFDAHGNVIADCCSGTLGSLVQDSTGRQFLLGNNHVLARSDHAAVGDAIVQPGLIDNNCTPNGDGPGTVPVGVLTAWIPLNAPSTNVDAAIAQVTSRSVDSSGTILELGLRQPDGTLASAPPGISSTGGKGENASLQLRVAKSGRTTGLTCASVTALDVDVSVDYYHDCAETRPYLTKAFTGQIGLNGDRFSDAGDSGALIVDTANAEPVGLFFAGGADSSGVGQGMANPAGEVLNELAAQTGAGAAYTFVGAPDHPVSCLSYGDSTLAASQARSLSETEIGRAQQALSFSRMLVNPSLGILGVAPGKSSDHPGEAAVIVYVDENSTQQISQIIDGVRSIVIPTTSHAVAFGSAPMFNALHDAPALTPASLTQALAVKRQIAHKLMQQNPAFFAVGVGQSLDSPREAALVIYVDRNRIPADLPSVVAGLRTRYIMMDRLHVTRSYSNALAPVHRCTPQTTNPDNMLAPAPDLRLKGLSF